MSKRTVIKADEELVIKGKLTIEGNVTQIETTQQVTNLEGNVFTINSDGSDTSAILALNSNGSVATMTFDDAVGELEFNVPLNLGSYPITTTGNISGANVNSTYFHGDGSNITGLTTTIVAEGTNFYFTTARVRGNISHVDAGGDGSFNYDSANGVFTYTGPSSTEVRAHFSATDGIEYSNTTGVINLANTTAGNGLTYSSGVLNIGTGDGITVNSNDVAVNNTVIRTTGDQTITGNTSFVGTTSVTGDIIPTAANTMNLGSWANHFNYVFANVLHAEYLDLEDANISDIHNSFYVGSASNASITRSGYGLTFTHNATGAYYEVNAGDGLQISGNNVAVDSTVIRTSGDQSITGNISLTGNLSITGNLDVTANINSLNVVDLNVQDTQIILNSNAASGANSTISVNRGGDPSVYLKWDEDNNIWLFTNDGTIELPIPVSTTDLSEGANLYFTTDRVNTAVDGYITAGPGLNYNNGDIDVVIDDGLTFTTQTDYSFNTGSDFDETTTTLSNGSQWDIELPIFTEVVSDPGNIKTSNNSITISSDIANSDLRNITLTSSYLFNFNDSTSNTTTKLDVITCLYKNNVLISSSNSYIEGSNTGSAPDDFIPVNHTISIDDVLLEENDVLTANLYFEVVPLSMARSITVTTYSNTSFKLETLSNDGQIKVDNTVVRTAGDQTISGIKNFTGELVIPSAFPTQNNTIYVNAGNTAVFANVNGVHVQLTSDSDVGQVEDVGATGIDIYAGSRSVTLGNNTVYYHGIKSIDAGSYLTISEASNVITVAGNISEIRTGFSTSNVAGYGGIGYSNATGVFSYVGITDSQVRGLISATGLVSFDSGNGIISTTADNYGGWTVQTDSGIGAAESVGSNETLTIQGGTNITVTNTGNVITIDNDNVADIESVSAGDGLTGGGNNGNVTLNIGAGDGITVNADNVAINVEYVRNQFSANGDLSYNATTGVFSFTNDAGDIEGVTAGNGLVGGGTTGTVTLDIGAGLGITVNADNVAVNMSAFSTTDLAEGANLYYSNTRVNAFIQSSITTTDIDEGANLYYTPARANSAMDAYLVGGSGLTYSSGTFSVGAGNYITVGANDVSVDATTTATGNKVVVRDSNGSFAANIITATATSALYADLAENYLADADYLPGTVLVFGGDAEVTASVSYESTRVAGVVTTQPAHVMNSHLTGPTVACIALRGRVPVKVKGVVRKGDVLVTAGEGHIGYAVAALYPRDVPAAAMVGKAITDKLDVGPGVVEALI